MRILGIDPGLQTTGWGILETLNGDPLHYIAHGHIEISPQNSTAFRLKNLFDQLSNLIRQYRPHEAAVEEIFAHKSIGSTLKLGLARGIALVTPAQADIPVYEYSATLVKKSVVGNGRANKVQVAMMVERLLQGIQKKGGPHDATDALAIAITHASHRFSPFFQRL